MSFNFRGAALFLLLGILPAAQPQSSAAQEPAASLARRIAAIVSVAIDEYALGVQGGRVVSEAEHLEARLFLDEAARASADLPAPVREGALHRLAELRDRAARLEPAPALRAQADSLRRLLAAGLGIALDPMPGVPPSLTRGAAVYRTQCAACHGERGAGDGAEAAALDPPPADLSARARLSGSSPLDFFRKVSIGIAGTAMPAYESRLTLAERWAVALYASGLRHAPADRRRGERWLRDECRDCAVLVSDLSTALRLSDDSLEASLLGIAGTRPTGDALAFARTAAAAEAFGSDRPLTVRRAIDRIEPMLAEVESLAAAGAGAEAQARALEAYLVFEGVERHVAARSLPAARSVEVAFAELRAAAGAGAGDVPGRVQAARRAVRGAADVVQGRAGAGVLFGQSLLIILREGLEAILIIGALIAFLVKAGARSRVREIGLGVGIAVGASLLTALAFATVVRVSAAQQEAIEGVTLLLAAVVLFSVASWMVSKIEADKWRAFVSAKMREALGSGRALALAGVAFLAVYREGVETVLFYAALFGTTDGAAGRAAVTGGLAVGLVVLALVYLGIQRWGLRIPLKPFFAVTGLLLTVMAVSFAGQGVAELQAAGWIPATPIALPAIPLLGLFPTVQTVVAQLALTTAFLAALAWIFWLSPRAAAPSSAAG